MIRPPSSGPPVEPIWHASVRMGSKDGDRSAVGSGIFSNSPDLVSSQVFPSCSLSASWQRPLDWVPVRNQKQTPLRPLCASASLRLHFTVFLLKELPHFIVPARHFPANQGEGDAAGIQDRVVELSEAKLVPEFQGSLSH